MKSTRLLSLILCLAMLVVFAASCSQKTDDPESTTPVPTESQTPVSGGDTADETTAAPETLMPLDVVDMEKRIIKIYWPEVHSDGHFIHNEITSDSISGDLISDAVYERNSIVEENYNVSIKSTLEFCSTIPKNIQNQHLAGNVEFDALCTNIKFMSDLAPLGMLADFNTLEYYSSDMPWWNDTVMDGFSIKSHRYFGAGDIIISDDYYPSCVLANSDMISDLGLESPYKLVKEGRWTVDRMMEMASAAPAQLDGNDTWNYDDRYGITMTGSAAKALYYSFGQTIISYNPDGSIKWNMTPEAVEPYLDIILDVFGRDNISYYADNDYKDTLMPGKTHSQTMEYMFMNNQVLFQITTFIALERQLGSSVRSAILPIPKLNEQQEEYINVLNDAVVVSIPSGSHDPDGTSLILSAMGRESVDTLTPAFYDAILTYKYAEDQDASDTVRLIIATEKVPDLATTYDWGGFKSHFQDIAATKNNDFASYYKKSYKIAEKLMNNFFNKFD